MGNSHPKSSAEWVKKFKLEKLKVWLNEEEALRLWGERANAEAEALIAPAIPRTDSSAKIMADGAKRRQSIESMSKEQPSKDHEGNKEQEQEQEQQTKADVDDEKAKETGKEKEEEEDEKVKLESTDDAATKSSLKRTELPSLILGVAERLVEQLIHENAARFIALEKDLGAKKFHENLDEMKACMTKELSNPRSCASFLNAAEFDRNRERVTRQEFVDNVVGGVVLKDDGLWHWVNENKVLCTDGVRRPAPPKVPPPAKSVKQAKPTDGSQVVIPKPIETQEPASGGDNEPTTSSEPVKEKETKKPEEPVKEEEPEPVKEEEEKAVEEEEEEEPVKEEQKKEQEIGDGDNEPTTSSEPVKEKETKKPEEPVKEEEPGPVKEEEEKAVKEEEPEIGGGGGDDEPTNSEPAKEEQKKEEEVGGGGGGDGDDEPTNSEPVKEHEEEPVKEEAKKEAEEEETTQNSSGGSKKKRKRKKKKGKK